jgi:hypothetical protein
MPIELPVNTRRLRSYLVLSLLLAGCAASVTHTPANLTPVADTVSLSFVTLAQAVEIRLDTGYTRTLKAGSTWRRAGRIAQGEVYKPHNGVFTLEGAHIHEAWLVIADGRLAGFYLPVERGFSPIDRTIDLPLSSTPNIREQ